MTEEELDKFYTGRRIYNTFNHTEWKIDSVDSHWNTIIISNDEGEINEMTLEYFNKHCIFTDELFDWTPRNLKVKCECGVDKLGYGIHSSYCPKAEKEIKK